MPLALPLAAVAAAAAALVVAAPPAQTVYQRGTTIWARDQTWDGLTLYPGLDGVVYLVDMAGQVVHRWTSPQPGELLAYAEPLDNGNILAVVRPPGQFEGHTAVELDWNGGVVWSFALPAAAGYIHHDLERLPNGNTLLLCVRLMFAPAISAQLIYDDYLVEVDARGTPVWIWETWQHFAEFGFDNRAVQLISAKGGHWAHTNSVHCIPSNRHTAAFLRPGNLMLSQRATNVVFIIDRASGRIVWKIGPNSNLVQGQHAPYLIADGLPGAGNILLFDNGSGTGYPPGGFVRGYSRVLEIDPLTQNTVWDYDASKSGALRQLFFADLVSNAQRLPNGNTFVCSGVTGRLFEVTAGGEIVWEYLTPVTGTLGGLQGSLLYRAYRVASNWPLIAPVSNQ